MTNVSRWLPSTTPAIVTGAIGSAVTYGLHALGIIDPNTTAVLTPIVGFLLASVVEPPKKDDPQTLGGLVGYEVQKLIESEPTAVQSLVKTAIGIVEARVPTGFAEIAKAGILYQQSAPAPTLITAEQVAAATQQ